MKILLFSFFFNILVCNNDFMLEAFNKYSIKNIVTKKNYSLSITKCFEEPINYHFSWLPTSNFIIGTKLINNFKNDNKLFYNFNFNLLFNSNNIFGMSINSLQFDNIFYNIKWNSYFLSHKFYFKGWIINIMFDYNFNKEFSFANISNYFQKKIFKSIDVGIGFNITNIDTFLFKPYFGIIYNL